MSALRSPAGKMISVPSGPAIPEDRWTGTKVISNAVLVVMGAFFVLPMLWLALASIDANASWKLELPSPTLAHFATVLQANSMLALGNSLFLSILATVIATVTAFLAAYSFSRQHIPWKGPILLAILFLSGVPISILIVPVYKMFAYLGWLSIVPTAVLLGVTSLPFEIYIIKNAIDAIPLDLEEAAAIERAGMASVIMKIVVPLTMPGIASAAIFGFVNAWGNFLMPLVLITDASQQPGPVRIYGFMNSVSTDYGAIAAFSILYSLPVVILYLISSGAFRRGFVLGGAVR